ncbi:MAG: hypothetical protein ACLP5H_17415 [Desulfomonilaceae bacterium]
MSKYEFEFVRDTRRGAGSVVSMNSSLGRVVIYREAWDEMVEGYGKEVNYVKLGITSKRPDAFWIIPCEKNDPARRKVHFSKAGGTAMLSARSLFTKLRATMVAGAKQYSAKWDPENEALEVDISDLAARYEEHLRSKRK